MFDETIASAMQHVWLIGPLAGLAVLAAAAAIWHCLRLRGRNSGC